MKFAMAVAPREQVGALYGPDGEPLRVDVQGLANSMRGRSVAAERYIDHHFLPAPVGELDGHRYAKEVRDVRPERPPSG